MMLNSFLPNLFAILVSFLVLAVGYFKWTYQYWQRKNLPYFEPRIPFGNFVNPWKHKENFAKTLQKLYNEMKRKNWKHGGLYHFLTKIYVVVDLDYVKNVLTRDFQHFVDRGVYYNEKYDPLSAHLFAVGGMKWRNLRVKLTPTFTSGKMKTMFQTVVDCESRLLDEMKIAHNKNEPIDIKEILACFTTDVIGSCAFGLELQSFQQEDSPFRRYGKKVFATTKLRLVRRMLSSSFPSLCRAVGIRLIPKDVAEFFLGVVKDTVEYREKNNYTRKDFMQLLIDLKNDQPEDKGDGKSLTIEEIAAQSFVFFLAGLETSSSTMSFALYELARNQQIQDKVRKEIREVLKKHNGVVTYDSLQDLHYLSQVIDESLRMYPPVPIITRKCVRDYKIPDENIIIEKGTSVIIPLLGIHYDEDHYPEPEKFDPERFSEANKNARHNYAHLPFGEGPRICIGMRFGLMQTKAGLVTLLRNYKFTVNGKTREPLAMKVNPFILAVQGEIWLNAHKL